MKRLCFLVTIFIFTFPARAGDVLMIDLDNSTNEDNSCKAGVAANNTDTGSKDSVVVLGAQQVINPLVIENFINAQMAKGHVFDTVVISGHNGDGHFFGTNGDFLSSDLQEIVQKNTRLKASLTNMALWGCYSATAEACQNFWMKNISPNIKSTIGFTLQSPANTRPGNWALLQDYCQKREKIAAASTEQEINSLFKSLNGIQHWNASICYKEGVCSSDYSQIGANDTSCFHSYHELYDRCKDFDPSNAQIKMFEKYMTAKDSNYANPPPDGEDADLSQGLSNVGGNRELRKFYGQLHLWHHCADLLKMESGYEMPLPEQVIRLTKFETVKTNFARIQQNELKQYDDRLRALGLNQFTLDKLSTMSRQEIVASTEGAVTTLTKMARASASSNGVDPSQLLVMAKSFDLTLRQLDWHCTDFTLVHQNATEHSACITNYGEIPEWPIPQ